MVTPSFPSVVAYPGERAFLLPKAAKFRYHKFGKSYRPRLRSSRPPAPAAAAERFTGPLILLVDTLGFLKADREFFSLAFSALSILRRMDRIGGYGRNPAGRLAIDRR